MKAVKKIQYILIKPCFLIVYSLFGNSTHQARLTKGTFYFAGIDRYKNTDPEKFNKLI
jgi:hypothetical protein